jgi:hypothetical protein
VMLVVVASSPEGTVMLDQHSEHHLGPRWELRKIHIGTWLPKLGTGMNNNDCGQELSGTWLCLSLAQVWRTRTVVRSYQVLDCASAWHRYEEQGLWSGVIRYLTVPQLGTDIKNKDCGQELSGTWLCLSLAQIWRRRTVVRSYQVLDCASACHNTKNSIYKYILYITYINPSR